MKQAIFILLLSMCIGSSYSQEVFSLKNDQLQITVNKTGAELWAIKSLRNGKDYLWCGDPKVWGGVSPILFPIVGELKDRAYLLDGEKYTMPGHGFLQRNRDFELETSSDRSITFKLKYNKETLKQYPFEFEFLTTYSLVRNKVVVSYEVRNLGQKEMYFSIGAHPSFKCPLDEGETYTDYYLEFAKTETAHTYPIQSNGLIADKGDLILDHSRVINLNYHLFEKDALVFKNIKSRKVSLCSRKSGKRVQVDFKGFPFIGFWGKPNADYVCIEPWMGVNDSVGTDHNLKTKEGILKLKAKATFKAAYTISIF